RERGEPADTPTAGTILSAAVQRYWRALPGHARYELLCTNEPIARRAPLPPPPSFASERYPAGPHGSLGRGGRSGIANRNPAFPGRSPARRLLPASRHWDRVSGL